MVSGDICQQFTKEMFDMYQGFAHYKDWDFEVLNYTPAEYGKSYFCLFLFLKKLLPEADIHRELIIVVTANVII